KVPQAKVPLISYATTDTVVRETIDETINAPENHRTIQITVGKDNTTLNVIKGYDGDSQKNLTYPMSESAYGVFLKALQHAGFTEGNDQSTLKDERGYCPLGKRYIFEVVQGGDSIERYWSTSCAGSAPSTFKGKTSLVLSLFQNQVPDYDKQVNNTSDLLGL
ncbi:MAG TPA: hypothetical protein VFI84_02500, partial [Candidatus Saccharimonadales bacterium]|nr:hypothetical protein [Candidatus Saccharimonadales bacterium]